MVKNLPASAGDVGSIPESKDPLETEMATLSSILAWEAHGQGTWQPPLLSPSPPALNLSQHQGIFK